VLSRDKLVGVINLQQRRPHNYSQHEIHLISTIGFLVGAEIEMARLKGENSELSEQLETRKVIERAKGILQRDLQLSEQEAYVTLQRQSRQRRKSMKEIAEAIVLSDDVKRTPGKPRPS
jgi:uroporphyrinogen-III synthase